MRFLPLVVALLFPIGNGLTQSPEERSSADAFVHAGGQAVEEALGATGADRVEGLLTAARAFAGTPGGDRALDVGVAHLATLLERWDLAPELDGALEGEWERSDLDRSQRIRALGWVDGFAAVFAEHGGRFAAEHRARLAQRLEALGRHVRTSAGSLSTAWLRTGSPLPVPPLAVSMRLDAECVEGEGADVTASLAPRDAAAPAPFAPLGPGLWQLTLAEVETGFTARCLVAVTGLEARVLSGPTGLVVFAHRDGEPVEGARVGWNDAFCASTDAAGLAALSRPDRHATLTVRDGEDVVRQSFAGVKAPFEPPEHTAHLAVDAPLARPGEALRFRVVVRSERRVPRAAPTGLTVPAIVAEPMAGEVLHWRVEIPGCDERREMLVTDDWGQAEWAVAIPEQARPGPVRVAVWRELPPAEPEGRDIVESLVDETPAEVAFYARSPLSLVLERAVGAGHDVAGRTGFELVARATWAHGAPAAGRTVRVEVDGTTARLPRSVSGVTDAAGELRIPVAADWDGPQLAFRARCGAAKAELETPGVDRRRLTWEATEAGGTATVRGEPGSPVVLALFREAPGWMTCARCGADGLARVEVPAPEGLGGAFDLVAAFDDDWEIESVRLAARGELERVEIELPREAARPGDVLAVGLRCVDRCGAPVAGAVAVTVVDERLYALAEDRVSDPSSKLWPGHARWPFGTWSGPHWWDPEDVLGHLVVDGRIPPRYGFPGSAGGVSPGPAAVVPVAIRADFTAAAFFAVVEVDAATGAAQLEVPMPDDLTTWRITAWAVGRGVDAARAVANFETRLPVSVQLGLPRILRVGDRVEVPVSVQTGGDAARVRATAREGMRGERDVAVDPLSRSAEFALPLEAARPGDGEVRVEAVGSVGRDALRRTLPVLEETIEQQVTRGAFVDADGAALEGQETGPQRLVLFAAEAMARAEAEAFLLEYPYGCVEQTLSGITPYLVRDDLDAGQRLRRDVGLRRLLDLLVDPEQGFGWWPGDRDADPAMTGLVLGALADMPDGAVPEAWMPRVRVDRGGFRDDVERIRGGGEWNRERFDRAERAVGALRFAPESAALRDAVAAMVEGGARLPEGLAARAGLALAAAGERQAAERVLRRLETGGGLLEPAPVRVRFAGEDPVAVAAERLALAMALGVDGEREKAARRALFEELAVDGGTTYGLARAVAVLARSRTTAPSAVRVAVRDADGTREVALDAASGFAAELAVRGDLDLRSMGSDVVARLVSTVRRPAATAEARDEGLRVRRSSPDAWAVGRFAEIELTVEADHEFGAVVLDCPLPAGFEVVEKPRGLEVRDDRVVIARRWLGGRYPWSVRFTVAPTVAGTVLWPPATVEAMYAPTYSGGTAGAVLSVGAAEAEPGSIPAMLGVAPPPPPYEPTPDPPWWALRDRLQGPEPDAAAVAELVEFVAGSEAQLGGVLDMLEGLDGDQARLRSALAPALLDRLSVADPDLRDDVWRFLPEATRRSAPPALIRHALDPWAQDDFAWLADGENGRAALRAWLQDPGFCDDHGWELGELPAELFRDVPLACFLRLDADDGGRLLAASGVTDADIAAMISATAEAEHAVLGVRALARRGSLPDGLPPWAIEVLGARRGDAESAWSLRRRLPDGDGDWPDATEPMIEELEALFLWALAGQFTPREIARYRFDVEEADLADRCAQLGPAERLILIQEFQAAGWDPDPALLPAPLSPAERAALWAWCRGDAYGPIERLAGTRADNLDLRRRILAWRGEVVGEDRHGAAHRFESLTGRDLETGAIAEVRGLVAEFRAGGPDQMWDPDELRQLGRLRYLLGARLQAR